MFSAVGHPVLELHERPRRPQRLLEFFPADDLARPPQQHRQNLKRLPLKLDRPPPLAQLTGCEIRLEQPEAYGLTLARTWFRGTHRKFSTSIRSLSCSSWSEYSSWRPSGETQRPHAQLNFASSATVSTFRVAKL